MLLLHSIGDVLLLIASAGACFLIFSTIAAGRFAARSTPTATTLPPVTILKPLHGLDFDLIDNLRSFCQQDYPQFQIVFGLSDPNDPARNVVETLKKEFPQCDMDLVISAKQQGRNPKISNLINMYPSAKYDYMVIADSDMRVPSDYLRIVTAPLHEDSTGLVTCMYRGLSVGGLWSNLGAMHLNYGFLPQAVVGDALGTGAGCFGATLALRRDSLNAIGGLAAVADELADDHALGMAVQKIGKRVVLSTLLVDTIVHEATLSDLLQHELRWMRTVRFITPAGYVGSAITHAFALATLGFILEMGYGLPLVLWEAITVCRILTAINTQKTLQIRDLSLWLLPLRDLLSFALFIFSFTSRTVQWRQARFRVDRERRIAP
jgi:ceramide glucosyltransferase